MANNPRSHSYMCSHVGKSMLKWIYSVKPSPSFCLSWSYFLRWHQQCEVLSFSVLCNPPADSFSFIQPAHWWIHCRNISSVSCRPTSPHLLTAWRPVRTTASQRYWHSVCQLLINKFNLTRRAVQRSAFVQGFWGIPVQNPARNPGSSSRTSCQSIIKVGDW